MMDDTRLTNTRPTDELETENSSTPETKRVILYGWSGTEKVRVAVTAAGLLRVTV